MTAFGFCTLAISVRNVIPQLARYHFSRRTMTANICDVNSTGMPTSATEEQFDVLNADGVKTGLQQARSVVHREGLWHRSAHVWIVSRARRAVLLQLRSVDKDTFPGRWDVSAAGHIEADDNSASAAARELHEELGLQGGKLEYVFTARAEATGETRKSGPFIDREFQDVYIYKPGGNSTQSGDVQVEDVVVQNEEVDMVQYWSLEEYEEALRRGDDRFVPRSAEYVGKFFPYVKQYVS